MCVFVVVFFSNSKKKRINQGLFELSFHEMKIHIFQFFLALSLTVIEKNDSIHENIMLAFYTLPKK